MKISQVNVNSDLINLTSVCRLCSCKLDLVWIFDEKFNLTHSTISDIIFATTTVKISRSDVISQKLCTKCVSVVTEMFLFRHRAVNNDKRLMAEYEKLSSRKTDPEEMKERTDVSHLPTPVKTNRLQVHASVKELFKCNPKIKLPLVCLKSNVNPFIYLETGEVENYFERRNIDFDQHVHLAMEATGNITTSSTPDCTDINPTIDLTQSDDQQTSHVVADTFSRSNKRKSSYDKSCPIKIPRLSDTSSVGSNNAPDLSLVVSHELHMCNICNSVYTSTSSLRRHKERHAWCQFCKVKLKSLEAKERHVAFECKIQKAIKSMVNLPTISLIKIETDPTIRRIYERTFRHYNLLPQGHDDDVTVVEMVEEDVIDITSDDDQSNSALSPVVWIRDSSLNRLLHEAVTDDKLIKNLLTQYNRHNRKIHTPTQTFLPTNECIRTNHDDQSFEFESLMRHLLYYKIPIEIKLGSTVNVCYKNHSRLKKSADLRTWHDLVPIDFDFERNKTEKLRGEDDLRSAGAISPNLLLASNEKSLNRKPLENEMISNVKKTYTNCDLPDLKENIKHYQDVTKNSACCYFYKN